jgi:hypothetical protein
MQRLLRGPSPDRVGKHQRRVRQALIALDPPSDIWLKGEPPVEISDIYEIIARYVETGLYADRGDPASAYWLDRNSDLRDLLKQPVRRRS